MTRRRSQDTSRKDIYFAAIPEWVLFHADLSPQAVRLYGVLARYAEGSCWPSRRLLAKQLHVGDPKTVDRALRQLEEASAVTVIERFDDAGDRTSNEYTVHVAPPTGIPARGPSEVAAEMPPPPTTDATTGGGTNARTGGPTNATGTRATSNNPPFPPTGGDCSGQHANCRTCGTTGRQLAAADLRRRTDDARAADAAAIAADRARREAIDPAISKAHLDEARALVRSAVR